MHFVTDRSAVARAKRLLDNDDDDALTHFWLTHSWLAPFFLTHLCTRRIFVSDHHRHCVGPAAAARRHRVRQFSRERSRTLARLLHRPSWLPAGLRAEERRW